MDFEVLVSAADEIRLAGEFDLAAVEAFREAADEALDGQREVVVDLRELKFIDSSGIRAILDLRGAADGKVVVLRGPQGSVRKVLRLTGLDGQEGVRIEE